MASASRKPKVTDLVFDLVELPPEGRMLDGAVTASELELPEDERWQLTAPVRFQLRLSPVNSGHDLLVQGALETELRVLCDRCDEPFDWHLAEKSVCHEYENAFGTTIDLTDDIREDILMALPQHFLCRPECLGLCPHCGANLNDGDCGCAKEAPSASPSDSPWAQLEALRP